MQQCHDIKKCFLNRTEKEKNIHQVNYEYNKKPIYNYQIVEEF